MSLILAIETSNPSQGAGIALGRYRPKFEPIATEALARGGDEELLPAIARLISQAQAEPKDVQRIGVSIGPGGFTGVRIALAATKMIALAVGAECVPVLSTHVVARRVTRDGRPFAVALASKRDSAHLCVFDADAQPTGPGAIRTADDLANLGIARLIADDHLPVTLAQESQRLGIAREAPTMDPMACLELAIEGQPVELGVLTPEYPREPEAVTRWRELHPG